MYITFRWQGYIAQTLIHYELKLVQDTPQFDCPVYMQCYVQYAGSVHGLLKRMHFRRMTIEKDMFNDYDG